MPRTREPKDRRSARWAIEKLGWLVAKVTYKLTIPGQPFPRNVDLWGFGDLLFLAPRMIPGVNLNHRIFDLCLVAVGPVVGSAPPATLAQGRGVSII